MRQLDAAPERALDATLALVTAAGTRSLDEAMVLEFRVLSRLLRGEGAGGGGGAGGASALLAPLADAGAELKLGGRSAAAAALARRRARVQGAWERALEAYLASGEGAGSGVFGDLFRRRYVHFRAPLGAVAFGDTVEEVLAEDEREAVKEGLPPAAELADDVLRAAGAAAAPRRGGPGGGGAGGAREQDEATEAESATLLVAVERSLQREALREAGERLRTAQAGEEGAARAARLSRGEQRAFGSLRQLRGAEVLR
jgi:hypothetical protein